MKHLQNLFLLLLIVFVALTGCARKVTYKPGVAPPDRALMQVDASGLDFNDDLDIASLCWPLTEALPTMTAPDAIRCSGLRTDWLVRNR